MGEDQKAGLQALINWKTEYDSQIIVINQQHQEILSFLNDWYHDLKLKRVRDENAANYMRDKFNYLDFYSKYHLVFEENMMRIMVESHGFPQDEYQRHVSIHQNFMKNFMAGLSDQLDVDAANNLIGGGYDVAAEALQDVAHWWFNHIKTPADQTQPPPPDHVYRTFMKTLAAEAKFSLLNDLVIHFAEAARKAALARF